MPSSNQQLEPARSRKRQRPERLALPLALLLLLAQAGATLAAPVTFLSSGVGAARPAIDNETSPLFHGFLTPRFSLFPPPPLGQPLAPFSALPHQLDNDVRADAVAAETIDFTADPNYDYQAYDAHQEHNVYGGKRPVAVQRPIVELGLPLYDRGAIPVSQTWLGETNLVQQKFYVYGDYRAAFAQSNNIGIGKGDESTELAHRINLEVDYWLTGTERFHAFIGPLQDGGEFQRIEDGRFFDEFNLFEDNTDTLFFEGDLGQIFGGFSGAYAPFDLPVTAGLIPLLFQNGVWALDTFWGAAVTLPTRNHPWLDWSNYDITLFAALDQVSSDAFDQAASSARIYGATTFIEARGGYFEIGYGYVDDRGASPSGFDRSYHNVGVSYTRRYGGWLSNSVRVLVNAGQEGPVDERTADGVLLLVENSLLTENHYHVVPYLNFFAGFNRPQPLARAAAFGGVLFNTGINFQVDALTNFPTLDATGADTFGFALGVDLLGHPDFDQQLILELGALHAFGDPSVSGVVGDQIGLAARWQKPIDHRTLIRADAIYGFTENSDDIVGGRIEYRWKF